LANQKLNLVHRCGICNRPVDDDENWTEDDCLICEACSDRTKDDNEYNDDEHCDLGDIP